MTRQPDGSDDAAGLFPPEPARDGKRSAYTRSGLRGAKVRPPISDWALQPGHAAEMGFVVATASYHISALCIGRDGRLWAWGCGSNEGRCGVERFLSSNGRQFKPSKMKCYMHTPHQVGVCHDFAFNGLKDEWPAMKGNGPLDGVRVLRIAASRNHGACIGVVHACSGEQVK